MLFMAITGISKLFLCSQEKVASDRTETPNTKFNGLASSALHCPVASKLHDVCLQEEQPVVCRRDGCFTITLHYTAITQSVQSITAELRSVTQPIHSTSVRLCAGEAASGVP